MSTSPSTWPAEWTALRSDNWTAVVDPLGAQLSILRDAQGRDLLWDGDPAFWTGRAPILFPIVGALNEGHYRWRGQRYALPRHGLARTRRFELLRSGERELVFRLRFDEETLKVYPFRFELDVAFRMEGQAFEIKAAARNVGDEPMPVSMGFHPAFRWPLFSGAAGDAAARDAHTIEFTFAEPAPVRRLDASGLVTPTPQASPVQGRQLALNDALFAQDVVIFDQLVSRQLSYGASHAPDSPAARGASGSTRLSVSFAGATHLGLWSKPGASFLCIEPWCGMADPVGFDQELDRKPGVFFVPPGSVRSLAMQMELQDTTQTGR
ncbi:MAG TPA: aldose 1-epimerase family protein [Steroidobacteraceae bacterium]|nr:aldose 1-epimerase family protein [Steroidobacteraceae bacterium]